MWPHMRTETKWLWYFTLGFWLFRTLIHIVFIGFRGFDAEPLQEHFTSTVALVITTIVFWSLLRLFRHVSIFSMFMISAPIAFLADICHSALFFTLLEQSFIRFFSDLGWKSSLYQTYMGALYFWAWFLGYLAITQYSKFLRENIAVIEARSQVQNAQLQMLRYQIDPHFLFNSLNSISSLILDQKNKRAEHMLDGLGEFLRSSFEHSDAIKITLREEIEIAKKYLLVEGVRFEDKLSTQFFIEPETLDCLVPSLILQPAIENALKHAISPKKKDGKITISSKRRGGLLYLSVADNGPGLSGQSSPKGIGLTNTRNRLKVLYDQRAEMTLVNRIGGGVLVSLHIPIEDAPHPEEAL